jgi:uridine kinase
VFTLEQGIFTILRDRTTSRQDFIFFTDRLSTLLVEHALQHLPYLPKTVATLVGVEAHGKSLDAQVNFQPCMKDLKLIILKHICGVAILRSYVYIFNPFPH